tara:strand:+ start:3995 stop:4318 length:324 start_codon:yes stop_codon:yes gene_type:complete
MNIPEEIKARLIFRKPTTHEDVILPVKEILPINNTKCSDCDLRVSDHREFTRVVTPFPHWREKCMICKKLRHFDSDGVWYDDVREINRTMTTVEYQKKYHPLSRKDK